MTMLAGPGGPIWSASSEPTPASDDWADRLSRNALVLFLPDAVVSSRVAAGARFLESAGFRAVAAAPVHITPPICRQLWRSSIGAMPAEQLTVCELLLNYAASLCVLFVDDQLDDAKGRRELSAAERITQLKGDAEPTRRQPGTLRAALDAPSRIFRLVHTSDTPQDVARELRVLFGSDRQPSIRLNRDPAERLAPEALQTMAQRCQPVMAMPNLDTTAALMRAIDRVERVVRSDPMDTAFGRLSRHLDRLLRGDRRVAFTDLRAVLVAADLGWDAWEMVLLLSTTITPRHGPV